MALLFPHLAFRVVVAPKVTARRLDELHVGQPVLSADLDGPHDLLAGEARECARRDTVGSLPMIMHSTPEMTPMPMTSPPPTV